MKVERSVVIVGHDELNNSGIYKLLADELAAVGTTSKVRTEDWNQEQHGKADLMLLVVVTPTDRFDDWIKDRKPDFDAELWQGKTIVILSQTGEQPFKALSTVTINGVQFDTVPIMSSALAKVYKYGTGGDINKDSLKTIKKKLNQLVPEPKAATEEKDKDGDTPGANQPKQIKVRGNDHATQKSVAQDEDEKKKQDKGVPKRTVALWVAGAGSAVVGVGAGVCIAETEIATFLSSTGMSNPAIYAISAVGGLVAGGIIFGGSYAAINKFMPTQSTSTGRSQQ